MAKVCEDSGHSTAPWLRFLAACQCPGVARNQHGMEVSLGYFFLLLSAEFSSSMCFWLQLLQDMLYAVAALWGIS